MFGRFLIIFVLSCCVFETCSGASNLPDKWVRCKVSPNTDYKRNKCLEESLMTVIRDLGDGGEPSLGVNDLDPMKIKKMSIGQGNPNSAVNLRVDFKDLDLLGLGDFKLKSITGKLSSPENWSIRIQGFVRRMSMIGDYKVDGKILVLPITGSGDCNITYADVKADGTIFGQSIIKNGEEYLKLTNNQTLSLEISKLHVYLENLFNGNKQLGDAMNRILNENWQLLYQELRPSMELELSKQFVKYSRNILEKIPFKNIFIVE